MNINVFATLSSLSKLTYLYLNQCSLTGKCAWHFIPDIYITSLSFIFTLESLHVTLYLSMCPLWSRMNIKRNYSHDIHNLHDSLSFIPCMMMFLLLIYDIHFLYLSLILYYTGTLPGAWSTFTSLQWLELSGNQLTGKSDSCDGYLPSLPSCNLYIEHVILPHFMHILYMTQTHMHT